MLILGDLIPHLVEGAKGGFPRIFRIGRSIPDVDGKN